MDEITITREVYRTAITQLQDAIRNDDRMDKLTKNVIVNGGGVFAATLEDVLFGKDETERI